MSEQPKTVRVEIEYEDGKIIRLEGADAVRWQEQVVGSGVIATIHGFSFESLPWKEFRRLSATETVAAVENLVENLIEGKAP